MSLARSLPLIPALLLVWGGNSESAYAQFVPVGNISVANSINNFLYNRPTISPYLNLTRTDTGFLTTNYHAIVRPELERRQQQAFQTAHLQSLNRRVEQIQNEKVRNQRDRELTTGHQTRFFSYLHYYPEPGRPQQQQR